MTKQEILAAYQAATASERKAITGAALDFISRKGHPVSRQALRYFRETEMSRSPLANLYLTAYSKAIQKQRNEQRSN